MRVQAGISTPEAELIGLSREIPTNRVAKRPPFVDLDDVASRSYHTDKLAAGFPPILNMLEKLRYDDGVEAGVLRGKAPNVAYAVARLPRGKYLRLSQRRFGTLTNYLADNG